MQRSKLLFSLTQFAVVRSFKADIEAMGTLCLFLQIPIRETLPTAVPGAIWQISPVPLVTFVTENPPTTLRAPFLLPSTHRSLLFDPRHIMALSLLRIVNSLRLKLPAVEFYESLFGLE